MTWLNLLKSKAGKLALGIPQIAVIAGLGLAASYAAFHAEKGIVEKERLRSISSISNPYHYDQMQHTKSGLSSINVANLNRDGMDRIATAEEVARMEKSATGNTLLDAADNLSNTIGSAMSVGSAYQTTDTDGLGKSRDAEFAPGSTSGATNNGARASAGKVGQATADASAAKDDGKAEGNKLATASMARATGGSGNGSSYSGPISSLRTGGNSNGLAGRSGNGAGEGYKFSGEMPSGTDPASMRAAAMGTSSFDRSRNAAHSAGKKGFKKDDVDLQYFAKKSAFVADKSRKRFQVHNSAANVFLDQSTVGGMKIEGEADSSTVSSSDFDAGDKHLNKLKDWGDEQSKQNQEHLDWLDKLVMAMNILISATAILVPLISSFANASDSPWTAALRIIAAVLAALLTAAWGVLMGFAIAYWVKFLPKQFSGVGFMITCIMGPISIAGAWMAFAGVMEDVAGKLKGKWADFLKGGILAAYGSGTTFSSLAKSKDIGRVNKK